MLVFPALLLIEYAHWWQVYYFWWSNIVVSCDIIARLMLHLMMQLIVVMSIERYENVSYEELYLSF